MALAVTAALAVAGCASAPAETSASSANTGGTPVLTQTQAGQVFDAYVTASNQAAATDDDKLALSVVTGAQQSLVAATLKSHAASSTSGGTSAYSSTLGIKLALGQYAYGTPTFYLPEPGGYPRFFVADVSRALAVTGVRKDATTSVGGAQVPLDGPVLMVFEQSAAAGPWQLASVAQFPSGTTLPSLATGKNGYIPQVPLTSTDLLAQPYAAGPLQAAVVDDGPASAAAKAEIGRAHV